MIVVSGCFTGSCFKDFVLGFEVPRELARFRTRVFFRGPNILDEGEEGGGGLHGHHQLACVQTLPPLPQKKKCGFFSKRVGGGVSVATG